MNVSYHCEIQSEKKDPNLLPKRSEEQSVYSWKVINQRQLGQLKYTLLLCCPIQSLLNISTIVSLLQSTDFFEHNSIGT